MPERILVVDDEPLNLDLLRRTLQREFEVVTASGGAEAIALLETTSIAVVLCDQMMPGKNGTELAAEVRARWPAVKFVLVTGVDEADDVVAAQRNGTVDEIIAKPWNGAKVRERLRALAAGG
jgi:two-component system response regulator HupR/HoxA